MVICFMHERKTDFYTNPQFFENVEECIGNLNRSILHEFYQDNLPEIDELNRRYEFVICDFDKKSFLESALETAVTHRAFDIPAYIKETGSDVPSDVQ